MKKLVLNLFQEISDKPAKKDRRLGKSKKEVKQGGITIMKQRKGFTLIELMIVIAIIIILAAIAIPNYLRMTGRAKIAAIQSDMKSIATALEAYNTDWVQYPGATWANLKVELSGTGGTINVALGTTVTGEKGPISYIKIDAFTALETKAGGGDPACTYALDATDGYKLIVTPTTKINGKTYIFTMTSGGLIVVTSV